MGLWGLKTFGTNSKYGDTLVPKNSPDNNLSKFHQVDIFGQSIKGDQKATKTSVL